MHATRRITHHAKPAVGRAQCLNLRHIQHRGPIQAHAAANSQFSRDASTTMRSLDLVLGSKDEEEEPIGQQQSASTVVSLLRVPTWAWAEIREPRVAPFAANVLYYLVMLVYTSYYVVQLAEGPQAADDLLARLVNDHAAVTSGDTLRLFTSFFVVDSVPHLILTLVALVTVAAELESLLGYSTFWALWCVTVVSGSFADAALSNMPITAGPAAGVGGVAAALLAHHLHNWRMEQLLAEAKRGNIMQPLLQLEQRYNEQQQQPDSAKQASAAGIVLEPAAAQKDHLQPMDVEQQQQGTSEQSLPQEKQQVQMIQKETGMLLETELEGPAGIPLNLMLPSEVKAFATLGGTAAAVLSALKDVADTDVATDWTALAAGFAAGGVLGWFACPVYALKLVPASSSEGRDISTPEKADMLLPVLVDTRRPALRANAVVGYAAALYAAVGAWLFGAGMLQ